MFPLSSTPMSILIVDDMPDNLRLLAKMLEAQQYTVRKALNGRIALQSAYRNPPNLILLDINMPEMNGYEVCQQLKETESTAHIPIIFISALDEISDKVRAFDMGGQDYITKPFHELEVLARIHNQLLIQQQRQQLEQEIQERQRAEAEVRQFNTTLEQQIQHRTLELQLRTLELQQALKFESTLKRISDKVRDSLDSHQILQNVVEELAIAVEVNCCDAVLYNTDHKSSIIRYQYVPSGTPITQGQTLYMADAPEIYNQLQNQRTCFAFCQISLAPIRNHSAILACPIFDDQVDQVGILGDLWLFKETRFGFSEMEIHLVQQVANQCAIALRQAKLYEAAQSQVQELQRLNQLKDDFLSTISHELRSPIASMKMVIKLLTTTASGQDAREDPFTPTVSANRVLQYLDVLEEECDRELSLVEDLLHLQHLEAGTHVQQPVSVNLQDWLLHLIEPFETRTRNQGQVLEVKLAPNLPTLDLDILSLNRIITELLNNACKYTPTEGTIAIAVDLLEPEADETPVTETLETILQLVVSNTGIEIPTEALPHIFDKFYRVPNNDPWRHGGTGLGLALVKKLVEQLNGSITVENAEQQIRFIVRLKV